MEKHVEASPAVHTAGLRCHQATVSLRKNETAILKDPIFPLDPFKNSVEEAGFLCHFGSKKTMFLYDSKSLAKSYLDSIFHLELFIQFHWFYFNQSEMSSGLVLGKATQFVSIHFI